MIDTDLSSDVYGLNRQLPADQAQQGYGASKPENQAYARQLRRKEAVVLPNYLDEKRGCEYLKNIRSRRK